MEGISFKEATGYKAGLLGVHVNVDVGDIKKVTTVTYLNDINEGDNGRVSSYANQIKISREEVAMGTDAIVGDNAKDVITETVSVVQEATNRESIITSVLIGEEKITIADAANVLIHEVAFGDKEEAIMRKDVVADAAI